MVTRGIIAGIGLVLVMVFGAGCDRSEATLTIEADGGASWSRVVTFTSDGEWSDDFDRLKEEAEAKSPETFVRSVLPVFFEVAGLPDEDWDQATAAIFAFTNLDVETTNDTVTISMSRTVDGFSDLTDGLFPGRFIRTAEGLDRYAIDNGLQVRNLVPLEQVEVPTGDRGWGGDTAFTLTVPGKVISHNAHEVIGADARSTTLKWDWLSANREDGAVDVVWDATDSPAVENAGNGRRIGLLAVAAIALIAGTAVLLTFRPPGFDED